MTQRLACPPAPGPLEDYAAEFDDLFGSLAQRRGFRAYLQGLLLPRERNKTLTALAGAEPLVGAQHPEVQRLQLFLSESPWDPEGIDARRLALLLAVSESPWDPEGIDARRLALLPAVSESPWDPEGIDARRLALLPA